MCRRTGRADPLKRALGAHNVGVRRGKQAMRTRTKAHQAGKLGQLGLRVSAAPAGSLGEQVSIGDPKVMGKLGRR